MEDSNSKIKKSLLFWEIKIFSSTIKKVLIFREMEFYGSNIFSKESFSSFSGNRNPKEFFIFQDTELSYIAGNRTFLYFLKKVFLIFRKKYIQNPDIIKTGSIFRELVYSKPEAYSEHCQTFTTKHFVKLSTKCTFRSQPSNFFPKKFHSKKLSYILGNETFFIFLKMELPKKLKKCLILWEMELSCSNLKKLLLLQERTCKAWKTKDNC